MNLNRILQRIKGSFAARLNFYILSSLIVLFSLGFGIFYHYAALDIESRANEKINNITERANSKVTRLLRSIEKIPESLSWVLPTYVTQADSIFSITRLVVKNNPEIFGCAIAFEANFFPSKGVYFAPYSYMQGDSVITTQINEQYDYYHKNWYRISKDLNISRWSRPYHELSTHDVITSTYSVPLHNLQKEVIGIFSVDLSLNWLTQLLDSVKPYPDSYNIIVNQSGDYILRSTNTPASIEEKENLFNIVSDMGDTAAMNIAHDLLSGKTGKATFYNHGKKYYVFYAPLIGTNWYMATICPYSHIYDNLHRFNTIVLIAFIILLILICFIISTTIKKITKPLEIFASSSHAIAGGDFNAGLPVIHSGDEMEDLYHAFVEMKQNLAQYVCDLEKTTKEKEKIESELRIAHKIQMSMLPKLFPPFPARKEIDLFATLYPARQVGGDFYDFFIREEHLYFAIGDVSGKGVPASLLMSSTVSLLRSFSSTYHSPALITQALNNSIAEQNDNDMFVTFFIGKLNLQNGIMKYCNAGHTPPILTNPDKEVSLFKIQSDLPLGIIKYHPYQEYTYQFHSGSGILFYTDGVTDAENTKREFYGKERLFTVIRQNHHLHPQEFIMKILEDIRSHTQAHEQSDDLSMLTFIYGREWNIKNL